MGTSIGVTERRDWKETLARVGLVGKGVVYAIIGILAIQLAVGSASEQATSRGAVEWLASQPFGQLLLVALTVALFALAGWRLLDAAIGDPVEGSEASDRAEYAVKGVLYLSLAVAALSVTLASWGEDGTAQATGGGSGGGGEQQAAATILEWPAGQWLVGLLGLAVIAFAAYQVKTQALDEEFMRRLDTRQHWVEVAGRAGYAARSVVLAIVGYFFVQAALTYDPGRSKGMSGALRELAGEGWGQLVLWAVALGLLAYGLFTLAEAKYRRAA